MPSAVIHHPGARISLVSRRLHVAWKDSDEIEHQRDLPLRDLERLILFECRLDEDTFDTFWLELLEIIDDSEDRLVAYRIDAKSARRTLTAGTMVCAEKVILYLI